MSNAAVKIWSSEIWPVRTLIDQEANTSMSENLYGYNTGYIPCDRLLDRRQRKNIGYHNQCAGVYLENLRMEIRY